MKPGDKLRFCDVADNVPCIRARKFRQAWIGVDLEDLDAAVDNSVVNAPEFRLRNFKGLVDDLAVRIGADVFQFLGNRAVAQLDTAIIRLRPVQVGHVALDDPVLPKVDMVGQNIRADLVSAILAKMAIWSGLRSIADRDAATQRLAPRLEARKRTVKF